MVEQLTNQATIIMIGAIVSFIGGALLLGFRHTMKNQIKELFTDEMCLFENKLDGIYEKLGENAKEISEVRKRNTETDIVMLWGLLDKEMRKVLNRRNIDEDVYYYIEEMFKLYKHLGGNHGVENTFKKVQKLYERNKET